jgi:hypothetical protein
MLATRVKARLVFLKPVVNSECTQVCSRSPPRQNIVAIRAAHLAIVPDYCADALLISRRGNFKIVYRGGFQDEFVYQASEMNGDDIGLRLTYRKSEVVSLYLMVALFHRHLLHDSTIVSLSQDHWLRVGLYSPSRAPAPSGHLGGTAKASSEGSRNDDRS